MGEELKYQLRLTLRDAFAKVARNHPDDPSIAPLTQLLCRHDAALKCQYDAFADYVKEAEAKGVETYPLYAWTKRTVDDPAKEAKYTKSAATRFTKGVRPTRSRPHSSRWSEARLWRRCSDTIPIPLTIPNRRKPGIGDQDKVMRKRRGWNSFFPAARHGQKSAAFKRRPDAYSMT